MRDPHELERLAPPATRRKRTLVLVENEADTRAILLRKLSEQGWLVQAHASAESALEDGFTAEADALISGLVLGEGRLTGVELINALRKLGNRVPVVLITAHATTDRLKAALNAGAAHLLEKPFTLDALRTALERVTTVDVDLARLVQRALARARLTHKEDEVARLVLKGLTSAEIAAKTGNSEKTIKQHLTQVYAKLGVAGRAEFFHLVFPS